MSAAPGDRPSGAPRPPAVETVVDRTGMQPDPQRGSPPAELLQRHTGRTLDPGTAVRFGDQVLQSTVYAGPRLIVRPTAGEDEVLERLRTVADGFGLDLAVDSADERLRELARAAGIGPEQPQPLLLRVELLPRWHDGPSEPPDAWPVLQAFRAGYPPDAAQRAAVALDHVLTAHGGSGSTTNPFWRVPGTETKPFWRVPGSNANPFWRVPSGTGNPYTDVPSGIAEYGLPGFGGRTPVAWVGPEPTRTPDDELGGRRRPVVVVLDTGIGTHRWLPAEIVDRTPGVGGLRIGLVDPATAAEDEDVRLQPLIGELDPSAGHGTFIAGLIRQKCADADLVAVRVVQGDGVVAEADLLKALNMLWLRQELALRYRRADELVDVVSMSLGYYHESASDAAFDPLLLAPIRALAGLGVAIVVSAGNDATTRPLYPAAFGPHPGGAVPAVQHDELPVVAVGASNPDRSVAMFSNEGPWVTAHRPGAALVSTMPPFDGSASPHLEERPRGETPRSTLDPDDFTAGFAVWSGTSFASPILAGEIAQYLHSHRLLGREDFDRGSALDRGWQAVTDRVPVLVRPPAAAAAEEHR
ncbi:S8 family serine peptidase [uncultured Friedmanniella sp.]|uniref:S8 family peptidase n=1 Tax=uncultured Friedmanniella sp. TaxID=335381 RepID=UPI0035C9D5A8